MHGTTVKISEKGIIIILIILQINVAK